LYSLHLLGTVIITITSIIIAFNLIIIAVISTVVAQWLSRWAMKNKLTKRGKFY